MSILLTWMIIVAATYLFFAMFAWLSADRILFQPQPSSYTTLPGLMQVPAPDGTQIAAVHLPNPAATYTMLYLHGNAEDLGDGYIHLAAIRDRGFSVVGMDYRGYGLTPGLANQGNVNDDVAAVFRHIVERLGVPNNRVILYGFSLGGGAAVQLATREPVAGLVLQNAFVSAYRVITGVTLLPGDQFRNLAKISGVNCPVLIIHGTADRTVPFSHGRRLFAAAKEPKRALWVESASHNNLIDVAGSRYWEALADFGELVEKGTR